MGGRRRKAGSLIIGGLASASAMGLASTSADSAHAASGRGVFTLGVLTVIGDAQDNTIVDLARRGRQRSWSTVARCAILGGTPTVANTRSIIVLGVGGNDMLTIDEANGACRRRR